MRRALLVDNEKPGVVEGPNAELIICVNYPALAAKPTYGERCVRALGRPLRLGFFALGVEP
jgi:hypothetical protein